MRRSPVRILGIGLFVASTSFFNYGRLTGCDCIRASHVVTLLVSGMGLGVVVVGVIMLIRGKGNKGISVFAFTAIPNYITGKFSYHEELLDSALRHFSFCSM